MALTRDYLNYLDNTVDIAPANSQEELVAAQEIASLMKQHGVETRIEEFDAPSWGRLPYQVLYILLFLGIFSAGLGGNVGIVGTLLSIAATVILFLDYRGTSLFEKFGPSARSQNVVAVHRASGPLVQKGVRPIVIVAHYDTPKESFLRSTPLARYIPTLNKISPWCAICAGVVALIERMGFLPDAIRRVLWIVGLIAALPLLLLGVGAIAERFSSCTEGANDNKSGVAAMLGVLEDVYPTGVAPKPAQVRERPQVVEPPAEEAAAPEPDEVDENDDVFSPDEKDEGFVIPRGERKGPAAGTTVAVDAAGAEAEGENAPEAGAYARPEVDEFKRDEAASEDLAPIEAIEPPAEEAAEAPAQPEKRSIRSFLTKLFGGGEAARDDADPFADYGDEAQAPVDDYYLAEDEAAGEDFSAVAAGPSPVLAEMLPEGEATAERELLQSEPLRAEDQAALQAATQMAAAAAGGVRHGKEVVEKLGILPRSCEIEYAAAEEGAAPAPAFAPAGAYGYAQPAVEEKYEEPVKKPGFFASLIKRLGFGPRDEEAPLYEGDDMFVEDEQYLDDVAEGAALAAAAEEAQAIDAGLTAAAAIEAANAPVDAYANAPVIDTQDATAEASVEVPAFELQEAPIDIPVEAPAVAYDEAPYEEEAYEERPKIGFLERLGFGRPAQDDGAPKAKGGFLTRLFGPADDELLDEEYADEFAGAEEEFIPLPEEGVVPAAPAVEVVADEASPSAAIEAPSDAFYQVEAIEVPPAEPQLADGVEPIQEPIAPIMAAHPEEPELIEQQPAPVEQTILVEQAEPVEQLEPLEEQPAPIEQPILVKDEAPSADDALSSADEPAEPQLLKPVFEAHEEEPAEAWFVKGRNDEPAPVQEASAETSADDARVEEEPKKGRFWSFIRGVMDIIAPAEEPDRYYDDGPVYIEADEAPTADNIMSAAAPAPSVEAAAIEDQVPVSAYSDSAEPMPEPEPEPAPAPEQVDLGQTMVAPVEQFALDEQSDEEEVDLGSTMVAPIEAFAPSAASVELPIPVPAPETVGVDAQEPAPVAPAADKPATLQGITREELLQNGRFALDINDEYEDTGDMPRDRTGLDNIADVYDPAEEVAQPRIKPEKIDDSAWGQSSFAPAPATIDVARRASLFDLPDPSENEVDPFVSEPETGAMSVSDADQTAPQAAVDGDKPKNGSFIEWLGVNEDFDAKTSGRKIGSWDNFSSDDSWKGGATTRDGLRGEEGRSDSEQIHELFAQNKLFADELAAEDAPLAAAEAEQMAEQAAEAEVTGALSQLEEEVAPEAYALESLAEEAMENAAQENMWALAEEMVQQGLNEEELREAVLSLNDDALLCHDIWFVALGASDHDNAGMKAFLAEHRSDIRGAFLVNLDSVGAGALTLLSHEGLGVTRRADRRMTRIVKQTAQDMHVELSEMPYDWTSTDATPAMRKSVRGLTIMGTDETGMAALSHTPDDIIENVDPAQAALVNDIVTELIRRS